MKPVRKDRALITPFQMLCGVEVLFINITRTINDRAF